MAGNNKIWCTTERVTILPQLLYFTGLSPVVRASIIVNAANARMNENR